MSSPAIKALSQTVNWRHLADVYVVRSHDIRNWVFSSMTLAVFILELSYWSKKSAYYVGLMFVNKIRLRLKYCKCDVTVNLSNVKLQTQVRFLSVAKEKKIPNRCIDIWSANLKRLFCSSKTTGEKEEERSRYDKCARGAVQGCEKRVSEMQKASIAGSTNSTLRQTFHAPHISELYFIARNWGAINY